MRIVCTLVAATAVIALGTACEDGVSGAVAAGTECPQPGYVTPTAAELTMTGLTFNGLALLYDFDPMSEHNGQPAACYSPDSNTARLEFVVDDVPTGVITMGATVEGGFDLNGTSPSARVQITNEDGVTADFGAGHWQGGTGYVNSLQPLDIDLAGFGVDDVTGQTLDITCTILVTP
jgi:hypothetical protein